MKFLLSLALASVVVNAQNCIDPPDGDQKNCPVWPTEFEAPFGLHATFPAIQNASSYFYYKFLEGGTQAQLVDYRERCFPFASKNPAACKLLFIKSGIYLSQPAANIPCCQFVADVGAVPANFLRAYTYKGTNQTAPDLYGNKVSCDYWEGPDGFKYWTTGHFDTTYTDWGLDILFQDGPTGVTWRWGNFELKPQADSTFALPGTEEQCAKSCSAFLNEEEHGDLAKHVERYFSAL